MNKTILASRYSTMKLANVALAVAGFVGSCASICSESFGQDVASSPWPSWRGPNGNGTVTSGAYPVAWSEQKSLKWKLPLEGRGASTPISLDGKLFFTLGKSEQNTLLAVGPDGKVAWESSFGKERPGKHNKASGSNPSAITDGKSVFAYFKSGDLVSVTPAGETNWAINLQSLYGEDSLWWDLGTSPVLVGNTIVIAVMQTGPSFLVAIDTKTGKEVWKSDRWLDVREEANQSYTTPVVGQTKQGDVLYTLGADHLTAHRASDGKFLWKVGGFNPANDGYFRSIASPVVAGDVVICPYARGSTLTAVSTEESRTDANRVLWRKDFGSDVPTPAYYKGRVYLLGDKGKVTCLEPKTGEIIWEHQLPKSNRAFSSSPIIAGGKMYCTREDATTFVVKGIDEGKPEQEGENALDGFAVATPVFVGRSIFIRTYESLYCIE